jgi:glycosyltransferase involved in cell wall biosynthesis
MKKILHIANWYPNKCDDLEGIFVKEQYEVFSKVTDGHMINVQVRNAESLCRYAYVQYSDSEEGYYLLTKIKSTKVIELLTTFLLLWALFKSDYKKYELLHFHIAYPLLTYYSWWKRIIKLPILICEHWSAYHFNFYMPQETKKLDRIKGIFKQKIPLITVSAALLKDIQTFSNTKDSPSTVIPNVIDQKYFYYDNSFVPNKIPLFFAVNNWRKIKNPFPMLEGFTKLHHEKLDFKLLLGGYGEELEKMKSFVGEKGFLEKVIFLGKMSKEQIASTLKKSDAYLFSSTYETFSVVSAQAVMCGVLLIGPRLSAIEEYADSSAYVALEENTPTAWTEKIRYFITHRSSYNREEIARKAETYLSSEKIAKQYKEILDEWFR